MPTSLAVAPPAPAAPPAAASSPGAPEAAPNSAERLRAGLMRHSLRGLLDRVSGSRGALPHLAALETALGERGCAALDEASLKVLSKIHTQLRILPLEQGDAGIKDLLALVQHAMRQRAAQTHRLSPFDPESTVVIMESTHSDFIDALGSVQVERQAS